MNSVCRDAAILKDANVEIKRHATRKGIVAGGGATGTTAAENQKARIGTMSKTRTSTMAAAGIGRKDSKISSAKPTVRSWK